MRRGLVEAFRIGSWGPLCGVSLLAATTGCRLHETRHVTVLDQNAIRLAERPLPARVEARSDSNGVLARVEPDPRCAVLFQDHALVREHIVGERGQGAAITGGALIGTGLLFVLVPSNPDASGFPPQLLGLTFMLAGTITAMAQPGGTDETHVAMRVGPLYQVLDPCLQPSLAPRSVALWLPGGTLVAAARSPTGLWRARVPDVVWARFGDRILADVIVDGVAVRRVLVTRPPAPAGQAPNSQ
jgi:hypothetical protein